MTKPSAVQIDVTTDPFFGENAYTVYRDGSAACWIVDPGLPPHAEQIVQLVRQHALRPEAIVLTHAHGDHIAGIDDVRAELGALPVYLAQQEWPALSNPSENLSYLGGFGITAQVEDVRDLPPGQTLELDGLRWRVLDTSGHSPGGRSLYCPEAKLVLVGDALFAGSIGRVDFHHSDEKRLLRNIRENLLALPDETRVLAGHGEETTIGRERGTNPFLIGLS
jgi:glyoxylase-like metal-dependent hydrolase (beta-lactamase superfamily II)